MESNQRLAISNQTSSSGLNGSWFGSPVPPATAQQVPICLFLALLLGLCLWKGLYSVTGLLYPEDEDLLRDVGFIQAILDGNLFGDPIYPGEYRWYPPLVAMVGAAGAWLAGGPVATFWVQVGPWLGLLPVLFVFFMARQLFGPVVAAMTATLFALVNPAISRPWITGGYTPWPFTATLAIPLFCAGICIVHRIKPALRWRDAVLIGFLSGLTALAHPAPALLLSVIVSVVACVTMRPRLRTVAWLVVVAAVEIAISLFFFLPLALHYGLHVENVTPGAWTDWSLALRFLPWFLQVSAPGLLAAGAGWLLRDSVRVDRRTVVILVTWIGLCTAVLMRHYACEAASLQSGVCSPGLIPVNHFLLYLVLGFTMLLAHALAATTWCWVDRRRQDKRFLQPALLAASAAVLLALLIDARMIRRAKAFDQAFDPVAKSHVGGGNMDWDLYRWVLANREPGAMFVTEGAGPAAWSVYAAARPLIGVSANFSNPYVSWELRESQRRQLLSEIIDRPASVAACNLQHGAKIYFLLHSDIPVNQRQTEEVFRTERHRVYRLCPGNEDPAIGAAALPQ